MATRCYPKKKGKKGFFSPKDTIVGPRDTTWWPFDYVLKVQLGGHSIVRNFFSLKNTVEGPPNYFILKFFSPLRTQASGHMIIIILKKIYRFSIFKILFNYIDLIILTFFIMFLVWRPIDEHLALLKKIPWIWKKLSKCFWKK